MDRVSSHAVLIVSRVTDAESPYRSEPSLAEAKPGERYQFERMGYFCVDKTSTAERLVFNRTVELRDTWARMQKRL